MGDSENKGLLGSAAPREQRSAGPTVSVREPTVGPRGVSSGSDAAAARRAQAENS